MTVPLYGHHKGNLVLTRVQINIVRQWFDSIQDTLPKYLEYDDYKLAAAMYEYLDMRVPNSITTELNSYNNDD